MERVWVVKKIVTFPNEEPLMSISKIFNSLEKAMGYIKCIAIDRGVDIITDDGCVCTEWWEAGRNKYCDVEFWLDTDGITVY